jgi:hypothetical protein
MQGSAATKHRIQGCAIGGWRIKRRYFYCTGFLICRFLDIIWMPGQPLFHTLFSLCELRKIAYMRYLTKFSAKRTSKNTLVSTLSSPSISVILVEKKPT